MWDLDDESYYFKLLSISIPHAETWGGSDKQKRERIRAAVLAQWPKNVPLARWWAFRLYVRKAGSKWDVENIPKLVVDSFSGEQLVKDGSAYSQLSLYRCDTIECVRMVQVAGETYAGGDSTTIQIYGAR